MALCPYVSAFFCTVHCHSCFVCRIWQYQSGSPPSRGFTKDAATKLDLYSIYWPNTGKCILWGSPVVSNVLMHPPNNLWLYSTVVFNAAILHTRWLPPNIVIRIFLCLFWLQNIAFKMLETSFTGVSSGSAKAFPLHRAAVLLACESGSYRKYFFPHECKLTRSSGWRRKVSDFSQSSSSLTLPLQLLPLPRPYQRA